MQEVANPLVQEVLLREAIESADGAVFVSDDSLQYVAVNEAACRLVGCSREELLRLRVDSLVDRPRHELAGESIRVSDGHVLAGTVTLRRADGSTCPVQYVSLPTNVGGLPYVLSVVW